MLFIVVESVQLDTYLLMYCGARFFPRHWGHGRNKALGFLPCILCSLCLVLTANSIGFRLYVGCDLSGMNNDCCCSSRLMGLDSRCLCFYSSGGWMFKIKVPARLVFGETSFPGLQMAACLLCPQMAFPRCVHVLVSLPLLIIRTSAYWIRVPPL